MLSYPLNNILFLDIETVPVHPEFSQAPEDMRKLDAELSRQGKGHEFYSYPNAGHAFMNKRASSYRAHADAASWPRTVDFFNRQLVRSQTKKLAASL